MSFRLINRQVCLVAASMFLGSLVTGYAQSDRKERGRPIEFSLPKSDEVTNNLQQLTSKKDSLKQLEEDLYKPLESFSPKGSLEGVTAPPPRTPSAPTVPSKRVKELLEKRKNWVFMSPEDLMGAPTVEDVLKTPQLGSEGEEKKELPALERYYRRLVTKQGKAENPLETKHEDLFGTPNKPDSHDERASEKDSNLPSGVRESAQALSRLVGVNNEDNPFSRAETHGDLSDPFGLGKNLPSKEQVQEHKKFMDDYHTLVDPSWHPPAVDGPGGSFSIVAPGTALPAAKPAASLPSALSPVPQTAPDAQMDVVSPQLGPLGLPDVNAQALGQTRSTLQLPTAAPMRVPPPAPNFAAPRRAFN
jgi:hypothetical protein